MFVASALASDGQMAEFNQRDWGNPDLQLDLLRLAHYLDTSVRVTAFISNNLSHCTDDPPSSAALAAYGLREWLAALSMCKSQWMYGLVVDLEELFYALDATGVDAEIFTQALEAADEAEVVPLELACLARVAVRTLGLAPPAAAAFAGGDTKEEKKKEKKRRRKDAVVAPPGATPMTRLLRFLVGFIAPRSDHWRNFREDLALCAALTAGSEDDALRVIVACAASRVPGWSPRPSALTDPMLWILGLGWT
jgi:hypothetical protein